MATGKYVILILTLMLTPMVFSEELACAKNENVIAECQELRGRIKLYDSPPQVRMWIVGTERLLGVHPEQSPILPKKVKQYLRPNVAVFADFTVCPFTREKPDLMQMVCVESAEHLKIETYNEEGNVTMIEYKR